MAATWDIFHADRLEIARGLTTQEVRDGLSSGSILEDDLARPSGSTDPWGRVGDVPEFLATPELEPELASPPGGPDARPEPAVEPEPEPEPEPLPPASPEADASAIVSEPVEPVEPVEPPEPEPGREPPSVPADIGEAPTIDFVPPAAPEPAAESEDQGPLSFSAFDDDDLDELHLTSEALPPSDFEEPPPEGDESVEEDEPVFDALFVDEDEDQDATIERPPPSAPAAGPVDEEEPVAEADDRTIEVPRPSSSPLPAPPLSDPDAPPVASIRTPEPPPLDAAGPLDPLEEDEDAASFTLEPSKPKDLEQVDLTAMVDVAFQLILFFLVTTTTIYFKALEVPKPEPEETESIAQQMRTLDELMEDFILVEIDPQGQVQVDREPIASDDLVSRLRQARSDTLRTSMLLMADFSTPHANAVRAVDAANELGLQIAIARPTPPVEQ